MVSAQLGGAKARAGASWLSALDPPVPTGRHQRWRASDSRPVAEKSSSIFGSHSNGSFIRFAMQPELPALLPLLIGLTGERLVGIDRLCEVLIQQHDCIDLDFPGRLLRQ